MPTYTITELAREFDVTPRAIRFYEDQGIMSPKREGAGGRIRVYSARERTRLKLTIRGKRLGLSLSEIKSLVDMYESPKDSVAQLNRFMDILTRHREVLEQQREDIEVTLAELATHEESCRNLLTRARAAEKPVAAKPVAGKPGAAKPGAAKPAVTKPAVTKPATAKPVQAKPAAEKPAAGRSTRSRKAA